MKPLLQILQILSFRQSSPLPPAPLKSDSKIDQKSDLKNNAFFLKIGLPGTPEKHQNLKKSAQILFQMLPGAPSQRALEKNCFWTLSGRSPCGSRTVNSMVFACSTKCIPTTFWLALGLLLAVFGRPWALKWRQGSEKGPSQKILKKQHPKKLQKVTKTPLKQGRLFLPFCSFLGTCFQDGSKEPPGRPRTPEIIEN